MNDRSTLAREEARLKRIFASLLPLSLGLTVASCAKKHVAEVPHADAAVAQVDAGSPCRPSLIDVVFKVADGGAPECRALQRLSCGVPEGIHGADGGCSFSMVDCQRLCPSYGAYNCQATDASCPSGTLATSGSIVVSCDFCPGGIGRRPRGLLAFSAEDASAARTPLGEYFARAAHLEGASVGAFRRLRTVLAARGAPVELASAAAVAAKDEIRHARAMARLARRFGGRRSAVRVVSDGSIPTLLSLAVENAVEGCVRETYGALVASWQAAHAVDPDVAVTMAPIAADETRHAALARGIAAWAEPRLSSDGARRVGAAVSATARALRDEVSEPHPLLRREAGLPSAVEQGRLLSALDATLWMPA